MPVDQKNKKKETKTIHKNEILPTKNEKQQQHNFLTESIRLRSISLHLKRKMNENCKETLKRKSFEMERF